MPETTKGPDVTPEPTRQPPHLCPVCGNETSRPRRWRPEGEVGHRDERCKRCAKAGREPGILDGH